MNRILVCDDDREIVEAIEIYLLQEGYEVIKAYDGAEALEVLKKAEGRSFDYRRDDAKAGRYPRHIKNPGREQYTDHYIVSKVRGFG